MELPLPAAPADALEIFLQPGEFFFGEGSTRIRTLLGSCVAIVLWHPRLRVGGMCHFMLPARAGAETADPPDGRYADEALQLFMRELRRTRTSAAEYRVKLFGGGAMFAPGKPRGEHLDIAARNAQVARELLPAHGFPVHGQDLGGHGHRNVILDLWSGDVWLRRAPLQRGRTS